MKRKIGFIGTGVMGGPIALHLAKHHDVLVANRTLTKAHALGPSVRAVSIEDLVNNEPEIIFTMLGFPEDVASVYRHQLFATAKRGTLLIDLTTSSPRLAKALNKEGKQKELHVLDCPVTGGLQGAQQGTLTLMVGGEIKHFETIKPLLQCFGKNILYFGEAGAGQQAKLANQIAIAGSLASLAEALAYSEHHHLPIDTTLTMLQSGAAQSYASLIYGPKMQNNLFEATFFIKHFLKDLTLAIEESPVSLPVLHAVYSIMKTLAERFPEEGVQAIIRHYRSLISRKDEK